jgi:hypothetical protein
VPNQDFAIHKSFLSNKNAHPKKGRASDARGATLLRLGKSQLNLVDSKNKRIPSLTSWGLIAHWFSMGKLVSNNQFILPTKKPYNPPTWLTEVIPAQDTDHITQKA